jgi:diaminobutyrate-2-oxoglutarate transaminase
MIRQVTGYSFDPGTGARGGGMAESVQAAALRRGLIVELGGRDDSVVRMLPPLNVSAEVVDTACSILVAALEECTRAGRTVEAVIGGSS